MMENLTVIAAILPQLYILLDVVVTTILTAFIGFEREKANKPAGTRTNMIVGGATCLIVSLTRPLIDYIEEYNVTEIMNTDPIRVLEAIVVGISFIGAGTVMKSKEKNEIFGLTTSATLLYSSGIGICVALKQYVLAIGITLIILCINYLITRFAHRVSNQK